MVATADGTPGYGLDNAWRKALARLRSLKEWLDPGTIRHLRAAGVGARWRCLEVGPAFNESVAASNDALQARGFDPEYGRRLLSDLRAAGLADIGTEGRVRLWPGGSAAASAWQLTFEQLQPDMAARGLDPAIIAAAIRACQDPGFAFMSQVTMAAWGRRR